LKKTESDFLIRVFPDKPISKKPAETRMGKGKGNVDHWAAVVKRGRLLCEIKNIDPQKARAVLKRVAYKLSMKTRFVQKSSDSNAVL
jgi:large subunit ribosomal protein L16